MLSRNSLLFQVFQDSEVWIQDNSTQGPIAKKHSICDPLNYIKVEKQILSANITDYFFGCRCMKEQV